MDWPGLNRYNFMDIIWTDRTSLLLDQDEVHVWGGISWRGATTLCMFSGRLYDGLYIEILKQCLLPFLKNNNMPNHHRFVQPGLHPSIPVQKFFIENRINWWRTPPESPYFNPMENLWHELEVYMYIYNNYNHVTCII